MNCMMTMVMMMMMMMFPVPMLPVPMIFDEFYIVCSVSRHCG